MNADLLIKILAVVALILFLVSLIMSNRSWKAYTIVMVCLVFLTACTAFYMSALVLRTQQAWREILYRPPEDLIARTLELEQQNQDLQYGKENEDGTIAEDGITQLEYRVRAMIYDRGRVWTDCQPAPMAGNSSTVTLSITKPAQPQVTSNLVVYLFDSKPISNQGAYLGEFKVTNVADPAAAAAEGAEGAAAAGPVTVTLQPAWPMSDVAMSRMVASELGGPWTMLDKMPVDSHDVFANIDEAGIEELGVAEEQLADLDRATRLGKLLPAGVLAEYIKDLKPAGPDDALERVEVLVKFEDDFPKKAFGEVDYQFKDKQQVWLPKQSGSDGTNTIPGADDLVAQGVAELVTKEKPRFARALRDYGYLFRQMQIAHDRQMDNIGVIEIDTAGVNVVLQDKLAIVTRYEDTKRRLTDDRNGFLNDLKTIHNLLIDLRDQTYALGRRMNQLRQENLILAQRLDAAQMQAVEAINRRSPPPQARLGPSATRAAAQVAATP